MKKKLLVLVLSAVMAVGMMSGCGAKSDTSDTKAKTAESSSAKEEETEEQTECELEDGTYTAEFKTDSGMFHVNEAASAPRNPVPIASARQVRLKMWHFL